MPNLVTPFAMLAAALAVLFNWTQLHALELWLYIDAFAVVSCFLAAHFFWRDAVQVGHKVFAGALATLAVAVVVQYAAVGTGESIVWDVLDFLMVMLLAAGAGVLFRVGSAKDAAAYDIAHITWALAGLMFIGGGVVLYNWTQADETTVWLAVHVLSIAACGSGAAALGYLTRDIFGRVVCWSLVLSLVAVVVRTAGVVADVPEVLEVFEMPEVHRAWEAVNFLLVTGLALGAGLLLRRA